MCLNWTHGGGLVCKLRPLARSCCLEGLWRTLAVVYIQIFPWHHHNRPYHCERTASRLICEVKHGRARSVLGWGTTWEARVTIVFFLLFLFVHCALCSRESGTVLLHGGRSTRGSSAHLLWLSQSYQYTCTILAIVAVFISSACPWPA